MFNFGFYIWLGFCCGALQALGFIFIARPEFMMVKNMDKILETTLNAAADSRIKVGLLDSLVLGWVFIFLGSNLSCDKLYVLTYRIVSYHL